MWLLSFRNLWKEMGDDFSTGFNDSHTERCFYLTVVSGEKVVSATESVSAKVLFPIVQDGTVHGNPVLRFGGDPSSLVILNTSIYRNVLKVRNGRFQ